MALAVVGITTAFQLNASQTTQLSAANNGRTYLIITNEDQTNAVRIAFGPTGNEANATTGHVIPPSLPNVASYLEIIGTVPKGAVSAYAASGLPRLNYTEV